MEYIEFSNRTPRRKGMMKRIINILFVAAVLVSFRNSRAIGEDGRTIPYKEVNRKYVITGPLGLPLGAVMTLEVRRIESNEKSQAAHVEIVRVNGNALAKPVRMRYRMLIARDAMAVGATYRVKAYQDGSFTGTPSAVLSDVMFQTADYRFEVVLVVYRIEKI